MGQKLLTLKRCLGKSNEEIFLKWVKDNSYYDFLICPSEFCFENIGNFVTDGFEKENETEEFSVLMNLADTPGLLKNISEYYLFEYNIYDEKNNILKHWKDYTRE